MTPNQTEGKGSNVYLVRSPKGKHISVGIIGPQGGHGGVALVKLDEFLRVVVNVVGPLALSTAMATHEEKA